MAPDFGDLARAELGVDVFFKMRSRS